MFLIKIIWNSMASRIVLHRRLAEAFLKLHTSRYRKVGHLLSSNIYKARHSGNHVIQEFKWNFNLKCINFSQTLIAPYLTLHKSNWYNHFAK